MEAEYGAAVAARRPVRLEFRLLFRDGDYRWVLGVGEPCHDAKETFLGYSGCTTDITDRRALEQRLVELGRTGEIAQLAGGIAHDFNNLLTGILGHVTLLLDESSLSPGGARGPGADPPRRGPRLHALPPPPRLQPRRSSRPVRST